MTDKCFDPGVAGVVEITIGTVLHATGYSCTEDWVVYQARHRPSESIGWGFSVVRVGPGGRCAFIKDEALYMYHVKRHDR